MNSELPPNYDGRYTDIVADARKKAGDGDYVDYKAAEWMKNKSQATPEEIAQGQNFMRMSKDEMKRQLIDLINSPENPFKGKGPSDVAKDSDLMKHVKFADSKLLPYGLTSSDLGVSYNQKQQKQKELYELEKELFRKKFGFVPSGKNLAKFRKDFNFPSQSQVPSKDLILASVLDGEEKKEEQRLAERLGKHHTLDELIDLRDKMGLSMPIPDFKKLILTDLFFELYAKYRKEIREHNARAAKSDKVSSVVIDRTYKPASKVNTKIPNGSVPYNYHVEMQRDFAMENLLDPLCGFDVDLRCLRTWLTPELANNLVVPYRRGQYGAASILTTTVDLPVVIGTLGAGFFWVNFEADNGTNAMVYYSTANSVYSPTTGSSSNNVATINPLYAQVLNSNMEYILPLAGSITYTSTTGYGNANTAGSYFAGKYINKLASYNTAAPPSEQLQAYSSSPLWMEKKQAVQSYRSVYIPKELGMPDVLSANPITQYDVGIFSGAIAGTTVGVLTLTTVALGYPTVSGSPISQSHTPSSVSTGAMEFLAYLATTSSAIYHCDLDTAVVWLDRFESLKDKSLRSYVRHAYDNPVRIPTTIVGRPDAGVSNAEISYDKVDKSDFFEE